MTVKDLEQYKYLKIEIRQCEREIDKCNKRYEQTGLECFIRGLEYDETRKIMLQEQIEKIKQVIIKVREIDAPTGDYLALRVIGNMTVKQIAKQMNITIATVFRYRKKAIELLEKDSIKKENEKNEK